MTVPATHGSCAPGCHGRLMFQATVRLSVSPAGPNTSVPRTSRFTDWGLRVLFLNLNLNVNHHDRPGMLSELLFCIVLMGLPCTKMAKLLDTSKRHRHTTPIPMSPPAPDMTKLLQTGRALGRKRKRVASGGTGTSAPSRPPVSVSTLMEVDEPPPAPVQAGAARSPSLEIIDGPFVAMEVDPSPAAQVHAGVVRSPSVEIISDPYPAPRPTSRPNPVAPLTSPVPFRALGHVSRANPVDPPTSPMNFSSASEQPSSESEDSDTPRPASPKAPTHTSTAPKTCKRKHSATTSLAGRSPYTNSRSRAMSHSNRPVVPLVVPAGETPPAGTTLPHAGNMNKGKGKAVTEDIVPRDRWPSVPPQPPVPHSDPVPLPPQPSGSGSSANHRSGFATVGDPLGPGMNPAAWHPYTGGGPGLVRSMDRFASMMETTRRQEKHFMAMVSVISCSHIIRSLCLYR